MKINLDGTDYIVSPQFATCVSRVLGTMEFNTADVETEKLFLMKKSNNQFLNDAELQRLAYLTHVKNVANTIHVIGAHHDPIVEWGFDGWDAVHGNDHNAHCGCVVQKVFDHHSKNNGNHFGHNRVGRNLNEYHIKTKRACEAHKHLANDPEAHVEALLT